MNNVGEGIVDATATNQYAIAKGYNMKRTEEHAGVEVSLARGAFTKIYYRAVLTAPLRIALECEANTCGLGDLCCERRGYLVEVILARAKVLKLDLISQTLCAELCPYHRHLLAAGTRVFAVSEARVHHVRQCEATPHNDA